MGEFALQTIEYCIRDAYGQPAVVSSRPIRVKGLGYIKGDLALRLLGVQATVQAKPGVSLASVPRCQYQEQTLQFAADQAGPSSITHVAYHTTSAAFPKAEPNDREETSKCTEQSATLFSSSSSSSPTSEPNARTNLRTKTKTSEAKEMISNDINNMSICDQTDDRCAVCDRTATSWHYNSEKRTCDGCKKFFSRFAGKYRGLTGNDILRKIGNCGGQCVITKQLTKFCKFCRFFKCLRCGMKTEYVEVNASGTSDLDSKPKSRAPRQRRRKPCMQTNASAPAEIETMDKPKVGSTQPIASANYVANGIANATELTPETNENHRNCNGSNGYCSDAA